MAIILSLSTLRSLSLSRALAPFCKTSILALATLL